MPIRRYKGWNTPADVEKQHIRKTMPGVANLFHESYQPKKSS